MQTINFNDKNVSVTMTYEDLQRMMKECVITTMKEMETEKKQLENRKWYDTSETAKMFGVHVSTICRWKHSGYLTPRTIGGRDFFSREEITHHLTMRQNGSEL